MDAVRNLEVTFRSLGGGSKEKMQEDWESIDLKKMSKLLSKIAKSPKFGGKVCAHHFV